MLENDYIVKYICKLYNIDLNKYEPINDVGIRTDTFFDKKFNLDRTYQFIFNNFKTRIRFVKYNNKEITYFKTNLKISQIIINRLESTENKVYSNEKTIKIPIKIINRLLKFDKIKKKIDVRNK